MTTKIANLDDEKFNYSIRKCTKVVRMPSKNRHYVRVTEKWIREHVSRRIWIVCDCYVGWIAVADILSRSSNLKF